MIRILNVNEIPINEILKRTDLKTNVEEAVTNIINEVRKNGDKALFDFTARFDRTELTQLEVSPEEISDAVANTDPQFLEILKEAAANITAFHEKQKRNSFIINDQEGIVTGQKIIPLEKVGVYVPGGTAVYPSTVLMDTLPARIAGCREIVITTPPQPDGTVNPAILAAASIAGVNKIYKIGGAQAIAALAYGTETVSKVDKIVGPGNAFVAEAKKQVYGTVSIDMFAGPSEILIIADEKSNPEYVAADLLSQAEHDRLASAILITDSPELADAVQQAVDRQLKVLPRCEIATAAIDNNSKIIITRDLDQAIEIANELAPEHLELCVDEPFNYLDAIKNAGSVFLGRNCPEALGDYFAGPNHTLPTNGTARFSSPVSVDDFVKKMQYTYYSRKALAKAADKVALFAEKEGLSGHARSVTIRMEENENE